MSTSIPRSHRKEPSESCNSSLLQISRLPSNALSFTRPSQSTKIFSLSSTSQSRTSGAIRISNLLYQLMGRDLRLRLRSTRLCAISGTARGCCMFGRMVFVSIKVTLRIGICRLVLNGVISIHQNKLNTKPTGQPNGIDILNCSTHHHFPWSLIIGVRISVEIPGANNAWAPIPCVLLGGRLDNSAWVII